MKRELFWLTATFSDLHRNLSTNIEYLKTENDEQIKIQVSLLELEKKMKESDFGCEDVESDFENLLAGYQQDVNDLYGIDY